MATLGGLCAATLAIALAGCGGTTAASTATATTAPATATTAPVTTTASPTPASQTGGSTVSIVSFGFMPASLTVKVGTKVTWTNTATIAHTTTSDSGSAVSWDSSALNPNGTFSFTFTTAGTYTYHCAIHPSMQGTIIVTA